MGYDEDGNLSLEKWNQKENIINIDYTVDWPEETKRYMLMISKENFVLLN